MTQSVPQRRGRTGFHSLELPHTKHGPRDARTMISARSLDAWPGGGWWFLPHSEATQDLPHPTDTSTGVCVRYSNDRTGYNARACSRRTVRTRLNHTPSFIIRRAAQQHASTVATETTASPTSCKYLTMAGNNAGPNASTALTMNGRKWRLLVCAASASHVSSLPAILATLSIIYHCALAGC